MLEIKYIIHEKQVCAVYDLSNDNFAEVSQFFNQKNAKLFNTKIEALCANLLTELHQGKPLNNYKSSKYYNDYIEFLKKEHLEYII